MKRTSSLFHVRQFKALSESSFLALFACFQVQMGFCGPVTSLVVGGFSDSRSGDISIPLGSYYTGLRAALSSNFTNLSFVSLPILTESNLAGVDLLILAPGITASADGTPLSSDEQNALLDYIRQGGGVLLLTDNYSYAPNAPGEEIAMLSPFGISGFGTTVGQTWATVVSPVSHPVTSGAFGTVTLFSQNFAGGITNLGSHATALATNELGVALAVIPDSALGLGSGRVVIFSDQNTFCDGNGAGYFPNNETLFLNAASWARRTNWNPKLNLHLASGQVMLSWPAASGFSLESSAALGLGVLWRPVNPAPVVYGTLNVVTNRIAGTAQFYRLQGQ